MTRELPSAIRGFYNPECSDQHLLFGLGDGYAMEHRRRLKIDCLGSLDDLRAATDGQRL
jgi:hypothetical protein